MNLVIGWPLRRFEIRGVIELTLLRFKIRRSGCVGHVLGNCWDRWLGDVPAIIPRPMIQLVRLTRIVSAGLGRIACRALLPMAGVMNSKELLMHLPACLIRRGHSPWDLFPIAWPMRPGRAWS